MKPGPKARRLGTKNLVFVDDNDEKETRTRMEAKVNSLHFMQCTMFKKHAKLFLEPTVYPRTEKDMPNWDTYCYEEPQFTIQTFIGDKKTKDSENKNKVLPDYDLVEQKLETSFKPMSVEGVTNGLIDNRKDSNNGDSDDTPSVSSLIEPIEEDYNQQWFGDIA